jgi:adenylate cyclase
MSVRPDPGEPLTREELARRAGADPEYLDGLVAAGVLVPAKEAAAAPGAAEPTFAQADVDRVRLARACDAGGLPLDGIARAVEAGSLSFAFVGQPPYQWPGRSDITYAELAAQLGIDPDLVPRMMAALGFAAPQLDDTILEDDRDILPLLSATLAAGVAEESLLRVGRVYADGLRRIVQAETTVFHEEIEMPFLRSGMGQAATFEASRQFGVIVAPMLERMILALYLRTQQHAWIGHMVEHVEIALEEAGIERPTPVPQAMCFLDLAGYTRLTEERGDQAAADLATRLGAVVSEGARSHGGQAVKWLGDGVMFHFRDAASAVRSALEMVARTPSEGLPPAHAGISAGPIVQQDGDYYGRTVNRASRISAFAEAGRTLVDPAVVAATEGVEDLAFEEVGPVELKGLPTAVTLFEAQKA